MLERLCSRLFRSPKQPKFVSKLDVFLEHMRAQLPLSASQKAEMTKNDAIAKRRDQKIPPNDKKIWSDF